MNFLFDENIPQAIAEGFSILLGPSPNQQLSCGIRHVAKIGKSGASDEEIISIAGGVNEIIVTFDRDFKHIKSYYSLYKQHGVGIVLIAPAKGKATYWDIVKLITNNWDKILIQLASKRPPFVVYVDKIGVSMRNF